MDSEQTTRGTDQVLSVLRRRALWILLCVIIVAGAAYGLCKRETEKYTATAALAFNNNPLGEQIAGLSGSNNVGALAQQDIDIELVKFSDVATKTASLIGHGLTGESVRASVSVSGKGESSIVGVSATSTSPVLAAAIANTYANEFTKEQYGANRQLFESALAVVNKQLARLSPAQRYGTDGLDLQDRAHTLGLLANLNYNTVQLAQEALVPSSPSSPRTKRDTILGAVLGLLLGLGVVFLLERFDRRIRSHGELEAIYRLPLLGIIPKSTALSRVGSHDENGRAALPPAEAEAFSLIRAHLRFFNVDRDVRTVAVASPAPGDGKTTVARHLAEAAARLGSRVLLLEIDLRHPTLAQQLGITSGPGLAGVLIGAISVDAATESVALAAPPGEGISGRTLDVLIAGSVLPPNPAELLESRAMETVIERSRSTYDLVVLDTPPLVAVSDAFPVLTKVDGVIIVGRVGQSRRDAAGQLQHVLASSGAPLLGVVANGVKASEVSGPGSYVNPGKAKSAPASANHLPPSEEFAPTVRA
jgi:receptor protein-tyrosine kinase